jgi:hypothetical protein
LAQVVLAPVARLGVVLNRGPVPGLRRITWLGSIIASGPVPGIALVARSRRIPVSPAPGRVSLGALIAISLPVSAT